ncbi:MAG: thiamine-binding protein [Phycisphaerae bacterium]|nr:thiamine-binding protein [Phycisphaerae bacterium]
MTIQADVSVYPLRTTRLGPSINRFTEELRRKNVTVRVGEMSTALSGEVGDVFAAVGDAFARAADAADIVLVLKASNACPTNDPAPAGQTAADAGER